VLARLPQTDAQAHGASGERRRTQEQAAVVGREHRGPHDGVHLLGADPQIDEPSGCSTTWTSPVSGASSPAVQTETKVSWLHPMRAESCWSSSTRKSPTTSVKRDTVLRAKSADATESGREALELIGG
jgi:hypothetical protein